MRTLRFILCDVFSERPLAGNPLAVFTDARALDAVTMQAIARETNLSETVFVQSPQAGGHARLRIFTPRLEVPFAGHPTLGSAFVLGGPLQAELVNLETGVGTIPVRLTREGATISFGCMEQRVPSVAFVTDPSEILAALGVAASELPVLQYDNGLRHVFVVLPNADAVAALEPDFHRLARATTDCVNVLAAAGTNVKTRTFAPAAGVDEDPATGSAAGPLALHLARHGVVPFNETLEIAQGAEIARPSTLYATAYGSAENVERIEVGGSAVIVGRGELRIP
jgi:trans-2,3-dihydro-3-hydroxyanthranilate isomerase